MAIMAILAIMAIMAGGSPEAPNPSAVGEVNRLLRPKSSAIITSRHESESENRFEMGFPSFFNDIQFSFENLQNWILNSDMGILSGSS